MGKAESCEKCLLKGATYCSDLATKVFEQLVEADAARENTHFGTHLDRHQFSRDRYPKEINSAMKKVWFSYGDLGYGRCVFHTKKAGPNR